jgi:AmmeMemoRadiSam system protein B
MEIISDLRPSPIAGQWYEGNPEKLAKEIDQFIEDAKLPEIKGEIIGVIAPHAGHRYSGRTAGYAFKAVQGMERDLVVIVSPLHFYSSHPLLTSAHKAYATPLGSVEIDSAAVEKLTQELRNLGGEKLYAVANDREHSLEIELPFLQCALKGSFKLLPVMAHTLEDDFAEQLGMALARTLKNRSCLLVASTDLSHFYSQAVAKRLDTEMLRHMAEFSPEGILSAERRGTGFACGATAVAAVLWAARELGANLVTILHHSTSGEVTGDFDSVVGYGAGVILKH